MTRIPPEIKFPTGHLRGGRPTFRAKASPSNKQGTRLSGQSHRPVRSPVRSPRAAALVEGVIGLMLIIIGTVCGTLLLIDTGMATYAKEKLGFIANQTATYLAMQGTSNSLSAQAKTVASQLIADMGLPISNLKVNASGTPEQVTVTITGDCSTFQNMTGILPLKVTLSDTATALRLGFSGYLTGVGPGQSNAQSTIFVPFLSTNPQAPDTAGVIKVWAPGANPN